MDSSVRMLDEEEPPIEFDTSLLQSLPFIVGYCVHSVFKSTLYSKCGSSTYSSSLDINEKVCSISFKCLSSLIEDTFDLDATDPVYGLIFSNDRECLKCPSVPVLEAVVPRYYMDFCDRGPILILVNFHMPKSVINFVNGKRAIDIENV